MTTAFTTNTQVPSMGLVNQTTGVAVTTAAAASNTTFNTGFTPRIVRWQNATDRIMHEWYDGMAADSAIKTAANGTRTLETTNGITVGTGYFTVADDVIVASKSHYWEAIG